MEHKKKKTNLGFDSVREYGLILIGALAILHIIAFFSTQWIEKNEIRHELTQWSQTISKPTPQEPSKELFLPQDIVALHVTQLEKTGFYEIRTDKGYLVYANPNNNYILAKSEEPMNREMSNFAVMLAALFIGELILFLGWWRFAQSSVRELFEVV